MFRASIYYKSIISITTIGLFCSFSFNKDEVKRFQLTGYAQGTTYQVTYYHVAEAVEKKHIDSILVAIDSSMSIYKPYSLISQFNKSEEGIEIDDAFRTVIEKSMIISADTKGLFDITVGPLVTAWGFGNKATTQLPDSTDIAKIKECVGYHLVKLEGHYLSKVKPCVEIDVNGIAQGYTVDVIANYLLNHGITSFIVEVGGELRIEGTKPDGSVMRIGIEGPGVDNEEPIIKHIAVLNSGALTTSGNYRKYKQAGAKRITHLMDPRTGSPLDNELISVTVFAEDAITADGYDNALMAMEVNEALSFVEKHPKLEAYIIYHDKQGKVADTMSNGFKQLLIQ